MVHQEEDLIREAELLVAELKKRSAREEAAGAEMFLDRPDRWYEHPHWRCTHEHVSTTYLKSEEFGVLCLACGSLAFLTFPEDTDGPLETVQ